MSVQIEGVIPFIPLGTRPTARYVRALCVLNEGGGNWLVKTSYRQYPIDMHTSSNHTLSMQRTKSGAAQFIVEREVWRL